MGFELINRITIKKDGVYISSHSSNDSQSFHSWKCEWLSKIYFNEGQKGLDREIISLLYNNAQIRGTHKSVVRYQNVINSKEAHTIYENYKEQIDNFYMNMNENDKSAIWDSEPTEKAKEYILFKRNMKNKMCSEIAELCKE